MGANFDFEIVGSVVGGLNVGKYIDKDSSSDEPLVMESLADVIMLPTTGIIFDNGNQIIHANTITYDYIKEGAYFSRDFEVKPHILVDLNEQYSIGLAISLDVNSATGEILSKIVGYTFYFIDRINNSRSSLYSDTPRTPNIIVSPEEEELWVTNFFQLYRQSLLYSTNTNFSNILMGTGALQTNGSYASMYVFQNGFDVSAPESFRIAYITPQIVDIEAKLGQKIATEDFIAFSGGNSGSGDYNSSSDIINLP